MGARLTTEEFVRRAREIHGDTYGYDLVVYGKNSRSKVTIVCPEHGPFDQGAANHLNGQGCPDCSGHPQYTVESFITRAVEKHGNKYDYSLIRNPTALGRVTIICRRHGPFQQVGQMHLKGQGCIACAGKKLRTTPEFIEDARQVHGDRYGYDRVEYIRGVDAVIITCPEHGDFEQIAKLHLRGNGCPGCRRSGPELEIARLLSEAGIAFAEQFTYPTLRYKYPLALDFIIPSALVAIEFDGPQHREVQSWRYDNYAKALQGLEDIRQRDIAKSVWAMANRIRLVRLKDPKTIAEDLRANGIMV